MNIAFKIPPIVNDIASTNLLVEVGNDCLSFMVYSVQPFVVDGFYLHKIEKNISSTEYAAIIKVLVNEKETLLKSNFTSVKINYNFPTFTLVPTKYFVDVEKENIMNLLFGKANDSYCFQENGLDNNIKVLYRLPSKIYETINSIYPKNKFLHSSSAQSYTTRTDEDLLACIIYQHSIKIIYFKNGKLQIIQFFEYKTPTDVSYHLLNVCQRFDVEVSEVTLVVSGLIEAKSNLYEDIYKYFLNISFAKLPANVGLAPDCNTLPAHFYTNLIAQAQCEL